jgi:hypothetical protein
MSESERKGSAWPWIAVPIAAVSLFFVLRECQHRLPPAEHASGSPVSAPAADAPSTDPQPADPGATPAPEPAPQ